MVLWIMRVVKENLFWMLGNSRLLPSAETIPFLNHRRSFDRLWGKLSRCSEVSCGTALGLGCAAAGGRACWQLYHKVRPTWAAVQKTLQVARLCSHCRCAAIPARSRAANIWVSVHSSDSLSQVRVWIIFRLFWERVVGLVKSSYLSEEIFYSHWKKISNDMSVRGLFFSTDKFPVFHTSGLQIGLQFCTASERNPANLDKKEEKEIKK